MVYNEPIPSTRQLKRLAELEGPFPIKNYRIIIGAERLGFDESIVQFLNMFPHGEIFWSRDYFLRRCASLQTTLRAAKILHT